MIGMLKYFILITVFFFNFQLLGNESLLTLKQQLDRLQREVSDLSKTVYSENVGEQSSKKTISLDSNNITSFDLRIYDLEKDIKKLNENFEETIFQIDDLKKMYEILILNNQTNLINNSKTSLGNGIEIDSNDNNSVEKNENSLGNLIINSEDLSSIEELQEGNNIIDSEIKLDQLEKLTPEEEFQKAFDLLRSQKFLEAQSALIKFIDTHNNNSLAGSAHYWLGEIYVLRKENREAALILAEGYQKFPDSIKAPDMLYKLAESLINLEKKTDACNTYKKLRAEFPQNKYSIKAENKISSLKCNNFVE